MITLGEKFAVAVSWQPTQILSAPFYVIHVYLCFLPALPMSLFSLLKLIIEGLNTEKSERY